MIQRVPTGPTTEQESATVPLLIWKHILLYTCTCLHDKHAVLLSNPCISWSWLEGAQSIHMCPPPPRALWKPVPDIDLSNRCDHMLTQRVPELHHSFPFTFPLAACGGVHCSFMDHCSVNLGRNKKEAHGRGMLCAITANDMPPCKLWP